MRDSRLFIAVDVLDFLRTLQPREQRDLLKRFRDIAAYPSKFSDFVEHDSSGGAWTFMSWGNSPLSFGMISRTGR
ncbi:MAG: hypothetical protein WDM80_16365 [Limisphaerales bacterium]